MLAVAMHPPNVLGVQPSPYPGRPHRLTDANMEDGPGTEERPALKEDLQEEATFQSSRQGYFAPR